jgi:hypothetical protein
MKKRNLTLCLAVSLVVLLIVANASALTGRLGNSRMVLRLETGETAERYLSIENVNDVPIKISLAASGDLADNLEIKDNDFSLEPGESRKAYFTVKADEEGTTETKINVMYTPPEGSGIGLTANIIVIASGESTGSEDNSETDNPDTGFSFNPTGNPSTGGNDSSFKLNFSPVVWLLISSIALVVIFIALLVYANKMKSKKRARRPSA